MDNGMSAADVMALANGKDGSFLGGNGILAIIIIFILLFGGGGFGMGGDNGALTRAEMQSGLVTNSLSAKLDSLTQTLNTNTCEIEKTSLQGFADMSSAINDLGWKTQQCCCETKQAIAAEGNATRALMQEQENARLRDMLGQARDNINNNEQSQYILSQLGVWRAYPPCPLTPCGCNM